MYFHAFRPKPIELLPRDALKRFIPNNTRFHPANFAAFCNSLARSFFSRSFLSAFARSAWAPNIIFIWMGNWFGIGKCLGKFLEKKKSRIQWTTNGKRRWQKETQREGNAKAKGKLAFSASQAYLALYGWRGQKRRQPIAVPMRGHERGMCWRIAILNERKSQGNNGHFRKGATPADECGGKW